MPESTPEDKKVTHLGGTIFLSAYVFGSIGILLYGFSINSGSRATIIGISILISGGSFLLGVLLGFLFGIPQTLQSSDENKDSTAYKVNTNLEQISDWLTKILVGVGLTQINKLPGLLTRLADALTPVLGNVPNSGLYGVIVFLYFLIAGFLYSYLVTRIYIGKIFRIADQSALEAVVEKLARQPTLDAQALDIVNQLLTGTETPKTTDEEFNKIIDRASSSARFTIFSQAQNLRHDNWQGNKKIMDRVIPVFRALAITDKSPFNHQYPGQLAFALKDKEPPDWKNALVNFNKAIEIRGIKNPGFKYYELNRAICKIAISDSTGLDENIKKEIVSDLREAAKAMDLPYIIENEEILKAWIEKYKIEF
ncbi:MAG TPA: hypothetical protein VK772_07920 [Puia sp.]|jgi:hypothetical protein|nr:hypothetical protein [Puia sp.]